MSRCEWFEFSRADLAERRIPTPLVREHFDVIELHRTESKACRPEGFPKVSRKNATAVGFVLDLRSGDMSMSTLATR